MVGRPDKTSPPCCGRFCSVGAEQAEKIPDPEIRSGERGINFKEASNGILLLRLRLFRKIRSSTSSCLLVNALFDVLFSRA